MQRHASDLERDPRASFRECMSNFTTGVTVVLAETPGAPAGATVNAFTSVSLEPLLVLASLRRASRTLETILRSGRFTISVLGRDQEDVAAAFARSGAPFCDELVTRSEGGLLYIREAVARMACSMHAVHTLGDHDVVVGEVEDMHFGSGEPLVFHRGAFVGLARDGVARAV